MTAELRIDSRAHSAPTSPRSAGGSLRRSTCSWSRTTPTGMAWRRSWRLRLGGGGAVVRGVRRPHRMPGAGRARPRGADLRLDRGHGGRGTACRDGGPRRRSGGCRAAGRPRDRRRRARACTSRSTPGCTATASGLRSGRRSSSAPQPSSGRAPSRWSGSGVTSPRRRTPRTTRRGTPSSAALQAGRARRTAPQAPAPGRLCGGLRKAGVPLRPGAHRRVRLRHPAGRRPWRGGARHPSDLASRRAGVARSTPRRATIEIGAADGLLVDARRAPRRRHRRRARGSSARSAPTESVVDSWPTASPGDEVVVFGVGGRDDGDGRGRADRTIGEELALRVAPTIPRHYRTAGE